jgi:hypothetical protein
MDCFEKFSLIFGLVRLCSKTAKNRCAKTYRFWDAIYQQFKCDIDKGEAYEKQENG